MKQAKYYAEREQTYIKHFFLERYLERVAYNIGSFADSFVYVDGFSGPWKSEDEEFEDTSFMIAINKLREVVEGLSQIGKHPSIRCVFVEKDGRAYDDLRSRVNEVKDFHISTMKGEFEELIPQILKHIRRDFALTFIDPTGWTGFALDKIKPLLQHRPGEVIVNLMYDHINRFLEHPDEPYSEQFDELFGGPGWEEAAHAGNRREEQIIDLYRRRLRNAGEFKYVTSTRVLKPTSDRSYFHLVYGTRHLKGLREFSGVEKTTFEEQQQVRDGAKQKSRVARTGQTELGFDMGDLGGESPVERERDLRLDEADNLLRSMLAEHGRVSYDDACGTVLELPLVWESDVKDLASELHKAGEIDVEGMKPRQRRVQSGHYLVLKK